MITDAQFEELCQAVDAAIREFFANVEVGKVLEIPRYARLEHLPGREVSYKNLRTGETKIWQLPPPPEVK